MWLRQCHNTISGNSSLSNFPTSDFVPNITLAPSLQYPMKTSCSNSLVNPFFSKQSEEAHRFSNSIKSSGKLTGAASPSTLAFRKMIKVDFWPTQVPSSTRTFILLLLSMILVKSFFSYVKTHDSLYQRQQFYCVRLVPCVRNYLPEDQSNFKVCERFAIFLPHNMLFWKLEQ